jgi:hypothetical protein
MALKRKSIQGQFANATAVLLAASATLTRYVRSVHVSNDSASAVTWNLAFAATATSAGPGVFAEALPANTSAASSRADRYYGGAGKRLDNTAISGFASAATAVSYEIIYDESDTLDAT